MKFFENAKNLKVNLIVKPGFITGEGFIHDTTKCNNVILM